MSSSEEGQQAANLKYVRSSVILSANLGPGETALLSVAREKYYGLNSSSERIWQLLETPKTIDEVCSTLVEEFDIDPLECERDTRQLISEMVAEELVLSTPNKG